MSNDKTAQLIPIDIDEIRRLKDVDFIAYMKAKERYNEYNRKCWKDARRQMINHKNRIYKHKLRRKVGMPVNKYYAKKRKGEIDE